MPRAEPIEVDYSACPRGKVRGVDVQRMADDIDALVRAYAKKHAPDAEPDDLVQEVMTAIHRKNDSAASAFDPRRSSFGHYVVLITKNKVGHLREKRWHTGEVPTEAETIDAARETSLPAESADTSPVRDTADRRTVGELVDQLQEAAREAEEHARNLRAKQKQEDARFADGIATATKKIAAVLGGGFAEDAELPPPPVAKKRPQPPVPDLHETVRATLATALERWHSAKTDEDARVAAEVQQLAPKPPTRPSPKRRRIERMLLRLGDKATSTLVARRCGVSISYAHEVLAGCPEWTHPDHRSERIDIAKRAAIVAAIARDPGASAREIARLCGCDHHTVIAVRRANDGASGRGRYGLQPPGVDGSASSVAPGGAVS